MPIDYFKPLNSLRDLPGSALRSRFAGQGTQDPSLEGYDLADQLASEAEENAIQAQRAGAGRDAQAFEALKNIYKGDMASNPITRQRLFLDQAEAANQAALREGFGAGANPDLPSAQAAGYGRQIETAKAMGPLRVAQENARAELEKARITGQSNVDVARIGQKPYDQFFSVISGDQGQGMQPGDTASMGGMSFHKGGSPAHPNLNPLYQQLATARQAAQTAGGGLAGFLGGGAAQQAKVDQLITAIMAQHPADEIVKNAARQISINPEDKNLPFDQIVPRLEGNITPERISQLRELLAVLRGRDF